MQNNTLLQLNTLRIGPCSFHIDFGTTTVLPAAVVPFGQSAAPTADLYLGVQATSSLPAPTGQRIFAADQAWELWASAEHQQIVLPTPDHTAITAMLRWLPAWPRQATLLHVPHVQPVELVFDYPLLQLQLMEFLGAHGGCLLHSCAVVDAEQSLLFVGPPEAGKSTLARLWHAADAVVLSDDRIIVQHQGSELLAAGTPWHSATPVVSPRAAPIQAIFLLRHAPNNSITPLQPTAAFRQLIPEVLLPLWHSQGVQTAMSIVDQLIRCIPCYELAFAPTADVVHAVRQFLR